jgi:hypothetical protein
MYIRKNCTNIAPTTKSISSSLLALSGSEVSLELLSNRQILERCAQTHTIDGLLDNVLATPINLADQAFAVSVNDKTKKVGSHVVTTLY